MKKKNKILKNKKPNPEVKNSNAPPMKAALEESTFPVPSLMYLICFEGFTLKVLYTQVCNSSKVFWNCFSNEGQSSLNELS